MVHMNEDYNDFETAASKPDGLAVMSFVIDISERSNKKYIVSNWLMC